MNKASEEEGRVGGRCSPVKSLTTLPLEDFSTFERKRAAMSVHRSLEIPRA